MQIDVQIVNAFIDGQTGGNPAGVVLNSEGLTAEQKLKVAQQVGISEIAFVSPSNVATFKLEFFTPTRQIPHCGHATVATFSLLRQRGILGQGNFSKETIDGTRQILIEGDMAFMEQRSPSYTRIEASSERGSRILRSLGLDEPWFPASTDPYVVNTGNSFLVVQLPDEASVAGLRPRLALVESLSDELDLIGYYVFSRTTKVHGRHAGARMFAPRFGIPEESATGMAAGPLACLLHDHLGVRDRELLIEQGWLMLPSSPSVIKVVLDIAGGRISRLMAGGSARVMSELRVVV